MYSLQLIIWRPQGKNVLCPFLPKLKYEYHRFPLWRVFRTNYIARKDLNSLATTSRYLFHVQGKNVLTTMQTGKECALSYKRNNVLFVVRIFFFYVYANDVFSIALKHGILLSFHCCRVISTIIACLWYSIISP